MHELKKQIRKRIASEKALHPMEDRIQRSNTLLQKLEKDEAFVQAKCVLLYHSLKDEVQTHEFVEKWKDAKQIVLPVVVGDLLELREYTGLHDLKTGAYGIEEPTGKLFTDYDRIELAIIPGVSFDKEGNRLGRGKGYYDRLLPSLKKAHKIGICYSFQMSEHIPCEPHDIKMDCIYTENERF